MVRSAREFGANAYLVKPVSRESMLETLRRVVPPRADGAFTAAASEGNEAP